MDARDQCHRASGVEQADIGQLLPDKPTHGAAQLIDGRGTVKLRNRLLVEGPGYVFPCIAGPQTLDGWPRKWT